MRILTFSTLFPNQFAPHHGIFVAERLRHLNMSGRVAVNVLAPVPWFPLKSYRFGRYGRYARVPDTEVLEDIKVYHPRYFLVPKIGMTFAPASLALASWIAIRKTYRDLSNIDLIDAHYFYPDGVAAAIIAHWLRKPVVITGRGTDLNLIPQYGLPRAMIRWAAGKAAALITVSEALQNRLVDLGASPAKVRTLRNGVDLEKFKPMDRMTLRRRFQLKGQVMLSVGHLIERKGHHFVIESLKFLKNVHLIIAGSGPEEGELRRLADELQLSNQVTFLGAVNHDELVEYYNAADCLVLCSSREGMANVLLESLACGTPVVATDVWGTPEIVKNPAAGVLIKERSAVGVAHAVRKLWSSLPAREETRAYAETFGWQSTTAGQLEIFNRVLMEQTDG